MRIILVIYLQDPSSRNTAKNYCSLTTDADKSKLLPRGLLECSMKFQNLLIKPVCLHRHPVSVNLIKIYLCSKQRKFA